MRYRWFESISLQRGVRCEPDFLAFVIGVDLIADPEKANDPRIAAKLLAAFLKAKRLQIEQALLEGDFRDARRAVNGGSHGLAEFTESYKTGLQLLS